MVSVEKLVIAWRRALDAAEAAAAATGIPARGRLAHERAETLVLLWALARDTGAKPALWL